MKSFLTTIAIILFIGISHDTQAQNFKDCETAFQLCGNSPFNITPELGIGMEDDGVSTSCVMSEANSIWISWTVLNGGILTFDLIPSNATDDLDFLVFKLDDENDCANKELIRCMASGENLGAPVEEWERCTGPTGLLIGDTDTIEEIGCQTNDNNYLAPLETSPGDNYVLMVNDFSQTGFGFQLRFGGDAGLDCISVNTEDVSKAENLDFAITPSISSGDIRLSFQNNHSIGSRVLIHDMNGKLVYEIDEVLNVSYDLGLSHLAGGVYVASLYKRKVVLNKRFIVRS